MTRFMRFVEQNYNAPPMSTYHELHRWSVTEYSSFWMAFWKFIDVKASIQPVAAYDDVTKFPGCKFYPGALMNFAENMLINKKHFEEQKSASYRDTLLEAIEEVGLNVEDANAFLNTNELEDYVWEWYGRTIYEKNIHSIPLFVFNVPIIDAVGLPFRSSGKRKPYLVKGSGSSDYFAALFEQIYMDVQRFSM